MDIKIFANEANTVIEALNEYKKMVALEIDTVKKSTETWNIESIVSRLKKKDETLTRVIGRLMDI